ncbi:MAG: DUF1836 domain-containing protein [Lachnospiraceae bacterium]|nr:DUF1836 domain-containing protein [Lachnospiraceae bacterium]
MKTLWKNYLRELLAGMEKTNYVKPHDIPDIDLYMDQVTTFMDEHLETTKRFESDKLLTKTMINNYTKNDLLPSPNKKKYSKDHMYLLVFIYYLKNVLSMSDIKQIVTPMTEMFFGEGKEISLEEIYSEVFATMEGQATENTVKDVMNKFTQSKRTFANVQGEKEREFLHIFSFISMLSFDVYMKKQMIEKIIDDLLQNEAEESEEAKK